MYFHATFNEVEPMKKNYFFIVSIILLFLSVLAFSDNLFWDVGQESNKDPKFIIHGILMLAWFSMPVVQTQLIRKGNIAAHKKWGKIGMLIAIGVFVSTLYVFYAVFNGWDAMPFYVKANRIFMLSFAVLVYLAYRNRHNSAKHKRYIFMASLLILEPILSRIAINDSVEVFMALVWNVLFVSLFAYDWFTLKKIHTISWMGFVWFYIVYTVSILL